MAVRFGHLRLSTAQPITPTHSEASLGGYFLSLFLVDLLRIV